MACSTNEKNSFTFDSSLTNTRWVLRILKDKKIFIPEAGKEIYMQFQKKENKLDGNAGCNNFFGSYTVNNGEIKLGPLARTRMFCELQMEIEENFIKALEQTNRYEVKDNYLYLFDKRRLLARFQAAN